MARNEELLEPRVLLLHEMSGVHTDLNAGLRAIGVGADVATFGDHQSLLRDREMIRTIGAAGRSYAERFRAAPVVARKYLRLYLNILAEHGPAQEHFA